MRKGDTKQAAVAFRASLRLQPGNAVIQQNLKKVAPEAAAPVGPAGTVAPAGK